MELSRRSFFGLLAGAVAVEVAKPVIYCFAPSQGWSGGFDVLSSGNWVASPYEAAVEAIELEAFALEIPNLIPMFSKSFYKLAQTKFVPSRGFRTPIMRAKTYVRLQAETDNATVQG